MVTFAACYPGQGAQKPGMAIDLYENSQKTRDLFAVASDVCGRDLYRLLAEGTDDELQQTENTQIAVTLANRSAAVVLLEKGVSLGCHAGFSLGELSAYAGAGVFDDRTLFQVIAQRSRLMAKASEEAEKRQGKLGMAAIVGLGFETVERVLAEGNARQLYCANDNGPSQVVVSGLASEISRFTDAFKASGARLVIPLRVSGPFHTPFMLEAEQEFAAFLSGIPFSDPVSPLYVNVTGSVAATAEEIRRSCAKQLSSPVRWTAIMHAIANTGGIDGAVETGPGSVLTGLWRSGGTGLKCKPAGTYDLITSVAEEGNA